MPSNSGGLAFGENRQVSLQKSPAGIANLGEEHYVQQDSPPRGELGQLIINF